MTPSAVPSSSACSVEKGQGTLSTRRANTCSRLGRLRHIKTIRATSREPDCRRPWATSAAHPQMPSGGHRRGRDQGEGEVEALQGADLRGPGRRGGRAECRLDGLRPPPEYAVDRGAAGGQGLRRGPDTGRGRRERAAAGGQGRSPAPDSPPLPTGRGARNTKA